MFTPLFLVIVLIETTDLLFAVDSIPAAFAITQNEFLVYTSNIFAVMGLRAMFFLLAGIIDKFYLLQKGLSIILFFIGAKMLLEIFDINVGVYTSFSVIIATLTLSIIFSVVVPRKGDKAEGLDHPFTPSANKFLGRILSKIGSVRNCCGKARIPKVGMDFKTCKS